jgi:hypothetical protein
MKYLTLFCLFCLFFSCITQTNKVINIKESQKYPFNIVLTKDTTYLDSLTHLRIIIKNETSQTICFQNIGSPFISFPRVFIDTIETQPAIRELLAVNKERDGRFFCLSPHQTIILPYSLDIVRLFAMNKYKEKQKYFVELFCNINFYYASTPFNRYKYQITTNRIYCW